LKHDSGNLKNLISLGRSSLDRNHVSEAVDILTRACRLAPQSVSAWANLGQAYLRYGKLDAAHSAFRKAVALDGDNAFAVSGCAGALMALGEFREAMSLYEKVIALDADQEPAATASIAEALEKLGRPEDAYAKLSPFLAADNPPAAVILTLAQLALQHEQFAADSANAADMLEKVAGSADEDTTTRARAYFKLGHLYRKSGDYGRSFRAFQAAHELIGIPYDLSEFTINIDRLKSNFQGVESSAELSNKYKNIFVLGLPRSGTSLIEKIVGVNSDVVSLGECNFFHQAVCEVATDDDILWGCRAIESSQLPRVRTLYRQKYLVNKRLSRYVCDKSLENVFLVGQILQAFPDARMIWTRRDLRDVCLSCYTSDFAGRHSYTHDLNVLGQYAKKVDALMSHWTDCFPGNFHVVNYEDFVAAPDAGIRALITFLGFDWDDSYLEFHNASNRVTTLSYNDVQRPVYRRAVGQWRHYEEWLAPLLDELAR